MIKTKVDVDNMYVFIQLQPLSKLIERIGILHYKYAT